jgi:hypothetical protein
VQQLAHFAVRIIEIAEVHAFRWTHGDAGWLESLIHAMHAECALVDVTLRVYETCIIRTRSNACFAARAFVVIDKDNATLGDVTRPGGAATHARRIFAMIASLGANFHFQIWERATNVLHYPVTTKAVRNIVFSLACHDTIRAAHAAFGVDDHGVARHFYLRFKGQ